MLVSACMVVEFLWVMGLAEPRYTGINVLLLLGLRYHNNIVIVAGCEHSAIYSTASLL